MDECLVHEKIPEVLCERDSWEGDPEGLCLLHSRRIDKDRDGKFTNAVKQQIEAENYDFRGVFFPSPIDFSQKDFNREAEFSYAIFREANFNRATFSGKANFFGATFFGKANFSEATFSIWVSFSEATFYGEAIFPGATFSGETYFSDATFSDGATFSEATFSGEADFSRADFSRGASFSSSTFSSEAEFFHVTFSWANFSDAIITANGRLLLRFINFPDEENRSKPFRAEFQVLKQEPGGRVLFRHISLEQISFFGTDLRMVEFDRVTWGRKWLRNVIYDETLLHQERYKYIAYVLKYGGLWKKRTIAAILERGPIKPAYADFARVERLYRQLKINYEEERDFKRVGDFHYGEMEMHRRGSFWRQWMPSWYNFYRVLSGYGERPLRAFIWLLLLIPAWAGLVWGLGIDQAGSQAPVNYWTSLLFIFEKATLQRPPWTDIASINWLGKLLGSLSVLLLPGQAALFILALRNRLGRRR